MAKKNNLVEQVERMKYLSKYNLNEGEVDEGWGKNLAAGAMMGAASLFPMKAQAQSQTSQNIEKPKTELHTDIKLDNNNFMRTIRNYEKNGYEKQMGTLPDMLVKQNVQNLPIEQSIAFGQTQSAATAQAMQKAGNPMKKFIMTKANSNNNIEVIIFYVK